MIANEIIKYYSGTATYRKSIQLNDMEIQGHRLLLDLGFVKEMASVKINRQRMQVIWSAPFRFDLTSYLNLGTNKPDIEVINMWVDQLIGDGKLPKNERTTKTNINKFDAPDADKYLRVSGLMGPVKISVISTHNLR